MKKTVNDFILKYKPWTLVSYVGRLPLMTPLFQHIYYRYLSGPKSVKIHINNECNYNCVYCYADKGDKALSTEKWLNFIDGLKGYDIQTIEISGGEPFLHKDLMRILEKCKGYQITIYTNGSLINEEWVKRIKSLSSKIIISIKYDCSDRYQINTKNNTTLDMIDDNIRLLVDNGIPVVSFITVTKDSIPYLKDTINRAIKLGAFPTVEKYLPVKHDDINDKLVINSKDWQYTIGLIKKVYSRYATLIDGVNRIQGTTCSCYTTQFSVMQNGDVLPCQFLPRSMSIGNITETSTHDLWERFSQERKQWMQMPDECQSCKNKYVCSGGCKSYSYYTHKDFSKKDPLCNGTQPTTYGHCSFTVIHSLTGNSNDKLVRL